MASAAQRTEPKERQLIPSPGGHRPAPASPSRPQELS